MSNERLPNQPESHQNQEHLDDDAKREQLRSDIEREAAKREQEDDKLEQVRRTIEREASSAEDARADDGQSAAPSTFVPRDRSTSFKQTMAEVRSKLSKTEDRFSKIIHQPVVEKISDAASKSIGRSSLLLGGFMATFIGSLVIYMNASSNGYSVSNLTFLIVLFVLGAGAGLALEIVYRSLKRYFNN